MPSTRPDHWLNRLRRSKSARDIAPLRTQAGDNREGDAPKPGEGGPRGPGGPTPPNLKPSRGLFGLVSVVVFILLLFLVMSSFNERSRTITWQEFTNLYTQNLIEPKSVELRDNGVYALQREGPDSTEPTRIAVRFDPKSHEFAEKRLDDLTHSKYLTVPTSPWTNVLITLVPFILILTVLWFLVARGLRSAAGGAGGILGNFGKSRHRTLSKEMTGVTFIDVAGIDEAKEEVTEIIQFLKNPKRFMRLGGRIPRGVLLIGEPGCGKTLLAKAIAGEADVPFYSISGSDFVEMFVGVGASRVRDLFRQAKESAPCIIFLDEIDAVGRRRGGGFTTGGHDEREQTLNAILVEMDGFSTTDGVIVIAATNRSDVLDPALTRPGRFDRQIIVPLPDVQGRVEILRVHAKKVKLGPDVDLERIARATPGFSGADLAAIINEAAIAATLHNKDFVEHEDLEEARDKVRFGRARKSRRLEKEENRATAYHEAGHAVLQKILPDADPLHKVTIIPRGQAMGATFSLPEKDRYGYGRKWLLATMRVACGGRIAEEHATSDISSGAAQDIMQVTLLARKMIVEWGMSPRLGFVRYEGKDTREVFISEKDFSDETAHLIDEEVRRMVDEAFTQAKVLLDANWDKVVAVAEALIKYETLSADDVATLMSGQSLARPTVSDLLAAESRKPADDRAAAPAKPAPEPRPDLPPGAIPRPA